jgi:flavin reductase (DIM6/NTAB) family NADH-FMN oxidoreductase RutF
MEQKLVAIMDYNRREIKLPEYLGRIYTELHKGVLITTQGDGKPNAMTISWGALGIDWARPVFTTYVRHSRYTHELLERGGEFTVNIPFGEADRKIMGFCGSKSGRDIDKFAALGLTAVPSLSVAPPAIAQLPLTLECRVVNKGEQSIDALTDAAKDRFYPAVDGVRDTHTIYYGEILRAYILEKA